MAHVEAFDAARGQLVGAVPSEAACPRSLSGPIGPADPMPSSGRSALGRGMASLVISLGPWRPLARGRAESGAGAWAARIFFAMRPGVVRSRRRAGQRPARDALHRFLLKADGLVPPPAPAEAGPRSSCTLARLRLGPRRRPAQPGQTKGGDAEVCSRTRRSRPCAQAAEAHQTAPEPQHVFRCPCPLRAGQSARRRPSRQTQGASVACRSSSRHAIRDRPRRPALQLHGGAEPPEAKCPKCQDPLGLDTAA